MRKLDVRGSISNFFMSQSHLPATGDCIEVFWPDDDTYYAGRVTEFNEARCRHRVEYFDGDIEELDLRDEKWRSNANTILREEKPKRVDSFLQAKKGKGVNPGSKTIAKQKQAELKSPKSVLPTSPRDVFADSRSYDRYAPARILLARIATRWLRDEARRPAVPVKQSMHALWVQICANLCVRYVYDWLDTCENERAELCEDLCDADAEIRWFLENCHGDSAELALRNYSAWKRPLSTCEWRIELDIMRDVAGRFLHSAFTLPSHDRRSSLETAQTIAAAALGTRNL